MPKTYRLTFGGYWLTQGVEGIPDDSGIYVVYACIWNIHDRTVTLTRIIYIGESERVQNRITTHEKWAIWQHFLQPGEHICFSFAPIAPAEDRQRAEAALIFWHVPPANDEFITHFPYPETTIYSSGKNALLTPAFTVPGYATRQAAGRV